MIGSIQATVVVNGNVLARDIARHSTLRRRVEALRERRGELAGVMVIYLHHRPRQPIRQAGETYLSEGPPPDNLSEGDKA